MFYMLWGNTAYCVKLVANKIRISWFKKMSVLSRSLETAFKADPRRNATQDDTRRRAAPCTVLRVVNVC